MTETETVEVLPSLIRISSIHSMRDIPYAYAPETVNEPEEVSFSQSVSSLPDLGSTNSSRLVNVSEILEQPKHSSFIKVADVYTLHRDCRRLEADIDLNGPTTINAIILGSVLERMLCGITQGLGALYSMDDTSQFNTNYYPLRNVIAHLELVGPMGRVFPNASQLSQLIKWDFRQLVNSFLTLTRTSPGFVATAYLELSGTDRKVFCGYQRGDLIEDVLSAQRFSPLGILFHGINRDGTERINYFAAICSQLLLEHHDTMFQILLSKFGKPAFFNNKASRRLDLDLRKLVRLGGSPNASATANTNHGTHHHTTQTSSISVQYPDSSEGDAWRQAATKVFKNLYAFIAEDYSQFVATIVDIIPQLKRKVYAGAVKHFKQLVKAVLSSPHTYGLLEDTYITEHIHRTSLQPLIHTIESLVDADDLIITKICGIDIELRDTSSYYEYNQLMVLSLNDIVYLYNALLPPRKSGSPQLQDDNEWCLENIQSDLEPVMKELSLKLPTARNRFVRDQQGLFMEYWQVFKIEEDGLVNDMDANSWRPENAGIPGLIVDKYSDICTILEESIEDAEANGEFLTAQSLKRLQATENPLNTVVHELERSCQALSLHKQELHNLLDHNVSLFDELRELLKLCSHRLNMSRIFIWYEYEVRTSPIYLRSQEIIGFIRGELALQRSNSASSISSRRYSARPSRRLSILSSTSVMDSFFVSKEYLFKPKLADKEVDITMKYLRSERVHNFCRGEELIHRFNCEILLLLNRILDQDFLTSTSTCYKKDVRAKSQAPASHRMSMSVLSDAPSSRSRNRKSSPNLLLDIFEWKSVDNSPQQDWSMGLELSTASTLPDKDLLTGLLLSDLGGEFITKGSETDEFMQQTGRMLLDGDGSSIQPILEHISMQNTPLNKLKGIQMLMKVVQATVGMNSRTGAVPSRHDVTYELSKLLGREPGTLYADLQIISSFVSSSVMESTEDKQSFWDVAEAALKILDQVVSKGMDLATRMLRYNETIKSTSLVATMGVNDAVSIWSFCARNGRPKAQRKLAELYLNYQHTTLEVMPFTKPAILFESIEPNHARNAVIAHWMQIAAQKGDQKAIDYCKQLQKADFI